MTALWGLTRASRAPEPEQSVLKLTAMAHQACRRRATADGPGTDRAASSAHPSRQLCEFGLAALICLDQQDRGDGKDSARDQVNQMVSALRQRRNDHHAIEDRGRDGKIAHVANRVSGDDRERGME